MPIALLLQSALAPLTGAGRMLDTWQAVLRLETLVVDRARSAFLVHWFGPRLPRSGASRLVVSIRNIVALGERYREARAASRAGDTGPNLVEPVAGIAGMAAGMLLSPSGAVLTLYGLLRWSLCAVGSVLLTITHSGPMIELMTGLGGGLLIAVGLPVALLFGLGYVLYQAVAGDGEIVQQYEALGDIARLLQAATRFIDLLTGPRRNIRNPLLRGLLEMFDALAALVAQLIGAFALVLTRIAPLVGPTIRQFFALRGLAEAAVGLVKAIFQDGMDALLSVIRSETGRRASPWESLKSLLRHAARLATMLVAGTVTALQALGAQLATRGAAIATTTIDHLTAVGRAARDAIINMPLVRTFRAAAAMVTAVRAIISPPSGTPTAPPPPAPSTPPGVLGQAIRMVPGVVDALVGVPPPRPSVPTAEDMIARARSGEVIDGGRWGPALTPEQVAPFTLGPATPGVIDALVRAPASMFSGERAAMRTELGGRTPEQALAALRADELRFRGLIYGVVGEVLPPQIQGYLPGLLDTFDLIDRHLYGIRRAGERPDFPVRELPADNGLLRPIVHRLVIRSIDGADQVSLENIGTDVVRLLREQAYAAPALAE